MTRKTDRNETARMPRDGDRTHRAKSATVARKSARKVKRAIREGGTR